jgi:transforming growth factor-beta-induced protein
MTDGAAIKTSQGGTILLKTTPRLRLNTAGIVASDVIAGNGVIHLVDTVLIPPPPAPIPESAKPDTPPPATTEKP